MKQVAETAVGCGFDHRVSSVPQGIVRSDSFELAVNGQACPAVGSRSWPCSAATIPGQLYLAAKSGT
jgi:hypothetical protein